MTWNWEGAILGGILAVPASIVLLIIIGLAYYLCSPEGRPLARIVAAVCLVFAIGFAIGGTQ